MSAKVLDRAYNKAYGAVVSHFDDAEPRPAAPGSSRLSDKGGDQKATAQDVIDNINAAFKDKDYFRLMGLPAPTVDEIGRPIWQCTHTDITKAYRKLALVVHPDKNPTTEGRSAFEALKEAQNILKDPGRLEDVMRVAAERAKKEQARKDAAASLEERIQLNAAKNVKTKELRRGEGKDFNAEIVQQMKRRQEEQKRKRDVAAATRYRREDSHAAAGDDDSDDEESYARRKEKAGKRKKPVFI